MSVALRLPLAPRAGRLIERNLLVYKHGWLVLLSGFFEPLFYLLGVGLGLGGLINGVEGVSYAAYVAPGLLASSCLNGAITDGFFNIFFKLHFQKTYDGILATPMRVPDIALGEMLWALGRGSLYAASFLAVLVALGEMTGSRMLLSWWALLALPASVVVSAAFSAMALCLTSFVRKVQDFDAAMGLLVMPMFLFSGIFFPVSQLPVAIQWGLHVVPLFHAVELLRALTIGVVTAATAWHLTYLVLAGTAAFVVAMHRLERALIK